MQRGIKHQRQLTWNAFSLYIRYRDRGACVTCTAKKHPKEMHAGHFKHLGNTKLFLISELDEANVWCQCTGCNTYKHGELYKFGKQIERKYGEEMITRLEREKTKVHKPTYQQLIEYKKKYEKKSEEERKKYEK